MIKLSWLIYKISIMDNYSEQIWQLNEIETQQEMSNTYQIYLEKYLRKNLWQWLNERDAILKTADNFWDEVLGYEI